MTDRQNSELVDVTFIPNCVRFLKALLQSQ